MRSSLAIQNTPVALTAIEDVDDSALPLARMTGVPPANGTLRTTPPVSSVQ